MTLHQEQLEARMHRTLGGMVGTMLDLLSLEGEARSRIRGEALDAMDAAVVRLKREHGESLALYQAINGGTAPKGMV